MEISIVVEILQSLQDLLGDRFDLVFFEVSRWLRAISVIMGASAKMKSGESM